MTYTIACLMAALSFLINKTLLKYVGPKVVLTYGPAVEEAAKTLLAWYLGADILATHIMFGLLGSGYDWLTSGLNGTKAAVCSVAGHTLFGVITVGMIDLTGSVWLAVSGAIVTHVIWNTVIIRLYAKGDAKE
ncbi:MAG TPA: hypothetical protein DCP36_16290 [Sporomusaceae bacterium]|nr:hypothetical protein [Sporomusaceae bacterium]